MTNTHVFLTLCNAGFLIKIYGLTLMTSSGLFSLTLDDIDCFHGSQVKVNTFPMRLTESLLHSVVVCTLFHKMNES